MPAPTVPYKVLADGYKITGGVKSPLRAVASYLVAWSDAFTFIQDVMGSRTGATVGPITNNPPWQFEPSPNLFAWDFDCEPCGVDGEILTGKKGLAPGEFWTHAKITLTFEVPEFNPLGETTWQLDPTNPLTYCKVQIQNSGKFETLKAGGYEFDDSTPVTGDIAKVTSESRIILTFPQIPFLPYRALRGYIGRVNLNPIWEAAAGTVMLEGTDIEFEPTSMGIANRSVQLIFVEQDDDWNKIPKPNGVPALVRQKGNTSRRIYQYVDFTPIFNFLQ